MKTRIYAAPAVKRLDNYYLLVSQNGVAVCMRVLTLIHSGLILDQSCFHFVTLHDGIYALHNYLSDTIICLSVVMYDAGGEGGGGGGWMTGLRAAKEQHRQDACLISE